MSMLSKRMCWTMAVTLVCVGQMARGYGAPVDKAAAVPPDQGAGGARNVVTIATGVDATEAGYLSISPHDMGLRVEGQQGGISGRNLSIR